MEITTKNQENQNHNNNNINTPKRARSSPEVKTVNIKKHKQTMADQASMNSIQQSLAHIQSQLSEIKSGQTSLEEKIGALSSDMQTHKIETKTQLQNMQSQIDSMKSQPSISHSVENKFNQEMLINEVVAVGIPGNYHQKRDAIIDKLNHSLNLSLNRESFRSIFTSLQADKRLCTLRMKFVDTRDKILLMKAVDKFSRNADGKWEPLVIEDMFEEIKETPNELCGRRLSFFNALTKANQDIIKMKKTVKPYILQERDGHMFIKKTDKGRKFEIHSTDDVKIVVRKFQNNQL
jgi:hypothetical protein